MTIGPAPMMRMLLMSLRFGIAHQLGEPVEEIPDVMRARAGFGVPLEAEGCAIRPREPLERTVEEGHMRRPQVGAQRRRIDGEAVVLARDHHLAGVEILHRMIGAVVPELHLEGLGAGCEAHDFFFKDTATTEIYTLSLHDALPI